MYYRYMFSFNMQDLNCNLGPSCSKDRVDNVIPLNKLPSSEYHYWFHYHKLLFDYLYI